MMAKNKHRINFNPFILADNISDYLILANQDLKQQFRKIFLRSPKKFRFYRQAIEILEVFDFLDMPFPFIEKYANYHDLQILIEKLEKNEEALSNIKITSEIIESRLSHLVENKVISPWLVSTMVVSVFAYFSFILIVEYSPDNWKKIQTFKSYFPRMINIFNNAEIFVFCYIQDIKEKFELFSIFYHNLEGIRRIFRANQSGFLGIGVSYLHSFDYDTTQYFNYGSLISNYRGPISHIFKDEYPEISLPSKKDQEVDDEIFLDLHDLDPLVKSVSLRASREQMTLKSQDLLTLKQKIKNLKQIASDPRTLSEFIESDSFKTYVRHLDFIPMYRKFNLSKYTLNIHWKSFQDIDYRLLLLNSFLEFKMPAHFDTKPTFFLSYLFPYRTPNKAYINWNSRSKKSVMDYSLFTPKKIHLIFHTDYSLKADHWEINSDEFMNFYQKILFNPNFQRRYTPETITIEVSEPSAVYGKDSQEFQDLKELYENKKEIHFRSASLIEKYANLVKKGLIFPTLKLQGIGLPNEYLIVLPNVKKEYISPLIKIFSFFNYAEISEIEGDLFLYEEEISFENGLAVRLHLPFQNYAEIMRSFYSIFEALEIPKFLILTDLAPLDHKLEKLFKPRDLEDYNPYEGLIWSEMDNRWLNHKLYTEEFEPIYPPLNFQRKAPNENK